MTRISDYFLVGAAAVCGAFLVLLGRQYIFRGAKSRAGRTFLLTVSIVTVFLGSSLFGRARAEEPIPGPAREAMVELEAEILSLKHLKRSKPLVDKKVNPFWRRAKWEGITNLFDTIEKMEPSELSDDRREAIEKNFTEKMASMQKDVGVSDTLANYLKKEYSRILKRRVSSEDEAEAKDISDFIKTLEEIKDTCDTLDKADEESLFVRNLLRKRLQEELAVLKDLRIKSRLETIGITREKYLAGLSDALDALSDYSKVTAQTRTNYLDSLLLYPTPKMCMEPRAVRRVAERGPRMKDLMKALEAKKITREHFWEAQAPLRAYRNFAGETVAKSPDIWVKHAGGGYVQLKGDKVDLFDDDIIVNKGDKDVVITLKDGRHFKLAHKEIKVFWEMELVTPPEALEKVKALIEQLGAEDFADREAAQHSLTATGVIARPHVEEAAEKHSDMEVRTRASNIMKQLEKTYLKENSGDLYVAPE